MKDLLAARYKVIGPYPGSTFKIGFVIESEHCYIHSSSQQISYELKDYPNIFRRLAWWEDRAVEDMPEYVKNDTGIHKVKEYRGGIGVVVETSGHVHPLSWYTPATLSDYQAYINQ